MSITVETPLDHEHFKTPRYKLGYEHTNKNTHTNAQTSTQIQIGTNRPTDTKTHTNARTNRPTHTCTDKIKMYIRNKK